MADSEIEYQTDKVTGTPQPAKPPCGPCTPMNQPSEEQRMKNFLKMMRWEAGMKQYELAIQLHYSAPYLSLVENGRVEPPEEFKEKAAQFFKVGVEEIFPEAERVKRIPNLSTQKNESSNRSNHINF